MAKYKYETYVPTVHNPIIIAALDNGSTHIQVASALGITSANLAQWRSHDPELDKMMCLLEEEAISKFIQQYDDFMRVGAVAEAGAIKKRLAIMCNHYLDHTYIHIPELASATHVYERHELIVQYVASKKISLEIGERLSKLIKDNAEIYNTHQLVQKLEQLEVALKNFTEGVS